MLADRAAKKREHYMVRLKCIIEMVCGSIEIFCGRGHGSLHARIAALGRLRP
jgi:hypothetical protein